MKQHQSETVAHVPKKAIYKHGKSDSTIIQKRELIEYPATALSQTIIIQTLRLVATIITKSR